MFPHNPSHLRRKNDKPHLPPVLNLFKYKWQKIDEKKECPPRCRVVRRELPVSGGGEKNYTERCFSAIETCSCATFFHLSLSSNSKFSLLKIEYSCLETFLLISVNSCFEIIVGYIGCKIDVTRLARPCLASGVRQLIDFLLRGSC